VVQRQLASESLAAAAASGAQLPEGNPICELGLAATEAAVDVWVTHVSRRFWLVANSSKTGAFCG